MLHLINHTSADQYWFSGNSKTQADAVILKPLSATGAFLNETTRLLFQGTYRLTPGSTSHPFSLRISPPFTQVVAVEVAATHVGTLVGHMYSLGTGYQLLAVSAGGNAVSANIELIGTHDIRVTAVLNIAGSSLGFVATGSPSADRTSGANVVGILRNRQV